MSADNGVYILTTKNPDGEGYEYRVAHCVAVDNISYQPDYGSWNKEFLCLMFGRAVVHHELNEAVMKAHEQYLKLIEEGLPVEYGVAHIGAHDVVFPKCGSGST